MKAPSTLSTVGKAFRVLELIAGDNSGYTLTELAKKLNLSMGAVQRLAQTLIALQYLSKEPKTKTLRLTPKIFLFGFAFLSHSEIREIAIPYMRRLNEELDEIVNLGIMISDEEVVYIERVDKTSGVRLTTTLRVGSRRPIHANAIGKVILAFLPEADQRRILDHLYSAKYAGKTYYSKKGFIKQLRNIRRLGYSLNKSELFQDIVALAVPILNHQGLPVAGINIVLPRLTPSSQIKRKYLPHLIEVGKGISRALGNITDYHAGRSRTTLQGPKLQSGFKAGELRPLATKNTFWTEKGNRSVPSWTVSRKDPGKSFIPR
jgi:DNA-binding IclR family transcriptional regulator